MRDSDTQRAQSEVLRELELIRRALADHPGWPQSRKPPQVFRGLDREDHVLRRIRQFTIDAGLGPVFEIEEEEAGPSHPQRWRIQVNYVQEAEPPEELWICQEGWRPFRMTRSVADRIDDCLAAWKEQLSGKPETQEVPDDARLAPAEPAGQFVLDPETLEIRYGKQVCSLGDHPGRFRIFQRLSKRPKARVSIGALIEVARGADANIGDAAIKGEIMRLKLDLRSNGMAQVASAIHQQTIDNEMHFFVDPI